jgi:membrane protein
VKDLLEHGFAHDDISVVSYEAMSSDHALEDEDGIIRRNLMTLKAMWDMLKEAWQAWSKDKVTRLGAALAYYTIFSLAPLLVIVIAVVGLVFGRDAAQGRIVTEIQGVVGEASAQAIQTMIAKAQAPAAGILATVISLITLLLGATGVITELKDTLNTIWNAQPPDMGLWSTLKSRLTSLALILGIGFLLLVSLVVSAALSALNAFMTDLFSSPWLLYFWQAVNFVVSLGVITALFAMLYRFLPDTEIPWQDVWVGAGLTALLFVISKTLIGLYLGKSSIGSAYGPAGALVLILAWVYYASLVFLFGAELTKVYAHHHGSRTMEPAAEKHRADEGQPSSSHLRQSPVLQSAAVPETVSIDTASAQGHTYGVAGTSAYRPYMTAVFALAVGMMIVGARRHARYS